MKKIKILGAGPSGLVAAINLAKAGYSVDVYEMLEDAGMRFRGDLQGLEDWSEEADVLGELRDMNIDINFDCDPFFRTRIGNCDDFAEMTSKDRPHYYLVRRGNEPGTLNCGLKEQALKAGVKIHFGKEMDPSEVDIVATGPAHDQILGMAKGIVFETDQSDMAEMVLHDKLAYKGYAYLLVTNGCACLCTAVFQDLGKVEDCFEETKKYFVEKFKLKIRDAKIVGGVGAFNLTQKYKKGGRFYIGEAAGLQDFLWGFGMRYAMKSGYLAAKSIIEKLDYSKLAKEAFSHKLKASIVNRYLWDKISVNNYRFFIKHYRYINKHMLALHQYTWWQRLIYPFALRHVKRTYKNFVE